MEDGGRVDDDEGRPIGEKADLMVFFNLQTFIVRFKSCISFCL